MSFAAKVFSVENIDFDEVVLLHREAFSQGLKPEDSKRIHQPEYFRWKWSSPQKSGLIAVVRNKSKYVSMNAMTWNPLVSKSQSLISQNGAWLSCDTATLPAFRGQGLFRRCLESLATEIKPDEVFAGFPNAQSLPGFKKFGWQSLISMNSYLSPVLPTWKERDSESLEQKTTEFLDFSSLAEDELAFSRSPDWMKWRYLQSPKNPYQVYHTGEGLSSTTLVVRKYQRMGLQFLVVMDWSASRSAGDGSRTNKTLQAIGRSLGCQFLFTQASLRPIFAGILNGWVQVPDSFLPKKQIFAGRFSPALELSNLKPDLKLGDWDGL